MNFDTLGAMENLIIILLLALIFLLGYVVLKFKSKDGGESLLLLQNQLRDLQKTLDDKLGESTKLTQEAFRNQFSESQKLVKDTNAQVTKHLVEVTRGMAESAAATKQVFSITEQLQNLEKVLKHQKQRGNLGEASLELSLSNVLSPDVYQMQYVFKNGEKVDAVIMTKEGLIPIDAKFSLDNYNRIVNEKDEVIKTQLEKEFRNDLKKRIDETAKYIRPKEKTLPFAFMFIPAEGIYYDLLVNEVGSIKVNTRSLIDYAYRDKNVIIVSPTTFSAYLQSVLYGFKAFKFQKDSEMIRSNVEKLTRHLRVYEDYFYRLGKSLGTTVSHYDSARKEFGKVDKDVFRISEKKINVKELSLEKPKSEEE